MDQGSPRTNGKDWRKIACTTFAVQRTAVRILRTTFARQLTLFRRKLADFTPHPDSVSAADQVKLVRYQDNPANWGPRKKATGHVDLKRKRSADDVGAEQPAAKQRETDDAP